MGRRDPAELGVAAAGGEGADAVAGVPVGLRAGGGHGAGDFEAEDGGCIGGRRILAGALQEVGAVDAGGLDAEDDFAFPGGGRFALG
jgi:hypothetical protein